MKILAFDTSTEWLSVALFDGRTAVAVRERAGNASSERILPMIGDLLAQGGLTPAGVGAIAYGAGPGSFTGVRIACGVAQGLAFGAGLPVLGVSTLGAIAHSAWRACGARRIVACLDARMHEVYVAAYRRDDDEWMTVRDAAVCKPEDIEPTSTEGWHGAGEGFAAYPQLVQQLHLASCDPSIIPQAQSIAELAWPRLLAGEGVPAELAEPLYVRHRIALTSAERAAGMRL